jgi:hypothetical protein
MYRVWRTSSDDVGNLRILAQEVDSVPRQTHLHHRRFLAFGTASADEGRHNRPVTKDESCEIRLPESRASTPWYVVGERQTLARLVAIMGAPAAQAPTRPCVDRFTSTLVPSVSNVT